MPTSLGQVIKIKENVIQTDLGPDRSYGTINADGKSNQAGTHTFPVGNSKR